MEEQTWTIVQFVEDQTVEAVPSTWVKGNECYWPALPQPRMANSIRRCDPVDPNWPTFSIKTFRNAIFGEYFLSNTVLFPV